MEDIQEENKEEREERQSPTAQIIHDAIFQEALDEMERPSSALFWSGLAAGLSMGFSMISEGILKAYLPDASWSFLISSMGYTVGFIIVILGRQQLFTENTLTPILPLLHHRKLKTFRNVMRLWGVVLSANLLGALVVSWVAAETAVFAPEVRQAFTHLGKEALAPEFWTVLIRGIFAGWLISLLVWMLPFAESGRVWVILLVTYIVAIGHFSHVVAGSVEVFTLAFQNQADWAEVLSEYTLPSLVGNILGGVILTAAINHAQVKSTSQN